MTEYYEEGGLLYEQSPPMHIKVESPEGPFGGGASENGFPREDEDSDGSCEQNSTLPGGLPFNVVVVHPNIMAPGMSSDDLLSIEQSKILQFLEFMQTSVKHVDPNQNSLANTFRMI